MLKGTQPRAEYGLLACAAPLLLTWHKRLGHLQYGAVIDMAKFGMTRGLRHLSCEHCILRKQTKSLFPCTHEGKQAEALLDIVYSDLTRPEDVPTP